MSACNVGPFYDGASYLPRPNMIDLACDDRQFATTKLGSPAQPSLTLTINAQCTSQPHTWVLVQGDDAVVKQIIQQAEQQGAPYLPPASPAVFAAVAVPPGQQQQVTVSLTPGDYTYLSTYPDDVAAGMRGTLEVR